MESNTEKSTESEISNEAAPQDSKPASPSENGSTPQALDSTNLDRVLNVELPIIVVLGEKEMRLKEILSLGKESVISFEKTNSDSLDLFANNQRLGSGKAVQVDDKVGLRLEEIDHPGEFIKKLT